MPATISHALSMTTPDDPAYENKPSNWNSSHLFTMNASGSEISGAFGNGGGITFGLSADGKVTAAAPAGAPSPVNFSAGTTSNNLGSIIFTNANGVSFQLNGSTMSASIATTYAGTGFTTGATAGTALVGTNNTAGLSLGVPAWLTTAMQSASSSVFAKTGFTSGATAGALMVGTHNTDGLSLGVPAWLTTAMPANAVTISNINISAGSTSTNASAFTFSNANNMTFGLNTGASAGQITGSFNAINVGVSTGGNTLGTTGTIEGAGGQYLFVGGDNITLSQSTNGANSGTVTIIGPNPGGGATFSEWPWMHGAVLAAQSKNSGTSGTTGGAGSTQFTVSMYVVPQQIAAAISFNQMAIEMSAQTVAGTGNASIGHFVGIYTMSNSTKLNLLSSVQWNFILSQNSVTARSQTWWWGTNSTSNSTGANGNTSQHFTGARDILLLTGANSLSAGVYYFAFGHTAITSSANLNSSNSLLGANNLIIVSSVGDNAGLIDPSMLKGIFTTTSNFTSSGQGIFPATIDKTAISFLNQINAWPQIFMRTR